MRWWFELGAGHAPVLDTPASRHILNAPMSSHTLAEGPDARGPKLRVVGAGLLLVLAVTIAFGPSLHAPFLFDDSDAVTNNPTLGQAWWRAFAPPADGRATTARPLVNLSFALNHAMSGLDVWSYHATNIALHAAAALLLFGLVRRTRLETGPAATPNDRTGPALTIAALWALHPLQTETVVCVSQRTELLCAFWYLLALYGFARGTEASGIPASATRSAGRRTWLAISWIACLFGMATKEVMVTAPVVILLYDRTFVAGTFRQAWQSRWRYYLGLGATWAVLAALLVQTGGSRGVAAGFGLGVSAWDYLLTQAQALALYAKLAVWPHPLVLDYGTGVVRSVADVVLPGLAVLGMLGLGIVLVVRRPRVGFLFAWAFIIIAPSSSIVPLVTQTMAEHRMYLPLAAIATGLVLGVRAASRRWGYALVLVAAGLGAMSFARARVYMDPVGIWTDTVEKRPLNARAQNNLACTLQQKGRTADAAPHFARAIALDPEYASARYNWGVVCMEAGRPADAIEPLSAAVRLAPTHVDAQLNLGNALMQTGRPAEAVRHYEIALRLSPAADIAYNLGLAKLALGSPNEAAEQFRAVLAMDGKFANAHFKLGEIAQAEGDTTQARREWETTLELAPDHLEGRRALALNAARAGDLTTAARHFRVLIARDPDDADSQANLGNVLLLQGNTAAAIACYESALRLRPDDSHLRETLDVVRRQQTRGH